MIPRHLAATVERAAARYPVVSVNGPRQSGKTTLLRNTFPGYRYVSLESPDERTFALEDPRGFLGRFDGPVILDEAQRTPDLFSYIQTIVDEDPAPGRFLLSGSRNFLLMQGISQSLAGRVRLTSLLPFSLAELTRRGASAMDDLLTGGGRNPAPASAWTDHAVRGFYPRIHDLGLDPSEWLAQYFQTYLERDVRDLTQVGDLEAFGRFVRLCAGRAGGLLNLSSLGNDCGVSHDTARRWLSVLEASFVTFRLQPYHRRFNKRLTKRRQALLRGHGAALLAAAHPGCGSAREPRRARGGVREPGDRRGAQGRLQRRTTDPTCTSGATIGATRST